MKFANEQLLILLKPIENRKEIPVGTEFFMRYAGDLSYYPDSPLKGLGYHLTCYEWSNGKLIINALFLSEEEADAKLMSRYGLSDNQITAILRDSKIDELFED